MMDFGQLLTYDRDVVQLRYNDLMDMLQGHFKLDNRNVSAIVY